MAVLVTIILLVVVELIVLGIVVNGTRGHDLTIRRMQSVGAFYASEAGMNMAIRETIIDLATAYLAYYGGTSDVFDLDDELPCNHFGMYWGPSNPRGVDVFGDPIGCEVCRKAEE